MLRMGELFAGYGGLGLGTSMALAALGHEVTTAWVAEFDDAPARILAGHWPDAPNLGDVTKIDFTTVEQVDILTGGFPCQDVSLAGRRAGMTDGTRSGLWSDMARAIDELRPGLVVIENVRGLLSARAGRPTADADMECCPICVGDAAGDDLRALGAVLGDLADRGLDAEWGGLEAAAVGAPHRRFRVFIVAWPADASDARGELIQRLGVGGELRRATGAAGGEAWEQWGGRAAGDRGEAAMNLFRTPAAAEAEGGPRNPDRPGATMRLSDQVREEQARGNLLPTPKASADFGDYAPAVARWEAIIGRPAPAPTETGPKGGARLSPAFVEWMMGLPEGHVVGRGLTRGEELRALGNGVVPQQAAAAVIELVGRAA